MKKFKSVLLGLVLSLCFVYAFSLDTYAQEGIILPGIYVDDISLEGKTPEEATKTVEDYVAELCNKKITLVAVGGNEVQITPGDVGFTWGNPAVIEEAYDLGQKGNIVQRYKISKDLEHESRIFPLEFQCDEELIRHILSDQCSVYNHDAQDATLTRDEGGFIIVPGQNGEVVDEEASLALLNRFLCEEWDGNDAVVELAIKTDNSRGTEEELEKVKDVLGTFSTSFKTSGSARSENVRNGCRLIDGRTLYPGDEFSTYDAVAPFSQANGYYLAGSYLNGQVVDSLGGGICQVSTTLYNAVLLSELEVTERHNHSMIVTYVDPSADAAISESAGKDFRFVNNTDAPIYIEGYTTEDKQIVFTIYGQETRDAGHEVSYESEVISKTYPDTEVIYTDASLPVGSVSVQSAHIGYKANLWKITKENGEEVSREMVNSSVYTMSPRSATVGVATTDPNVYNEIMAAVATNNIDHVKGVAAALAAGTTPPEQPAAPAEQPAAPAEQPAPPAEQPAAPAE